MSDQHPLDAAGAAASHMQVATAGADGERAIVRDPVGAHVGPVRGE